jgi:phosphatidate phosphatase APP1
MVATILSPSLMFTRRDVAEHVLVKSVTIQVDEGIQVFYQDLTKAKPDLFKVPPGLLNDQEAFKSFSALVKSCLTAARSKIKQNVRRFF